MADATRGKSEGTRSLRTSVQSSARTYRSRTRSRSSQKSGAPRDTPRSREKELDRKRRLLRELAAEVQRDREKRRRESSGRDRSPGVSGHSFSRPRHRRSPRVPQRSPSVPRRSLSVPRRSPSAPQCSPSVPRRSRSRCRRSPKGRQRGDRKSRTPSFTAKDVIDIINTIKEKKSLQDVPTANIINHDETNLTDDPGRKKVIVRRRCKYPERVLNHSKGSVSIMMAGTAEGDLLPPYVVYKSTHLYDSWVKNGPAGT
ncbi:hypothetical protein HF086_015498, partial [Spodoptera exigua]